MALYRYLFADLLTDTIREEMPLQNVSYGDVLDAPGALSADLPLSLKNTAGYEKVTRANLDPGKTAVYVERDGVLVWGGILWTLAADAVNYKLSIGCEGFWSYFRRRLIRTTKAYAATDQLAIVQDLMNTAQAISGGNIGVTVGSETSGVQRDATYNAYQRANLGQEIEALSGLSGGFDFAIDVMYDGSGNRTKKLNLSYPSRGARTAHVLDLGGSIESLSWNIDATQQANLIDALGQGSLTALLIGTAADTTELGVYPLLEDTVSYPTVSVPATLNAHAAATLASRRLPVETLPTLVSHGTTDLQIGAFRTGDELEVRAKDTTGFISLDSLYRVAAWTVSVNDDGKETIAFSLAPTEAIVT